MKSTSIRFLAILTISMLYFLPGHSMASQAFRDQMNSHYETYNKLILEYQSADAKIKKAEEENDLKTYKVANESLVDIHKRGIPYQVGHGKASELKDSGSLLSQPITGEVCNGGQCSEVDPITALFLMLLDALVGELNKDEPFGKNNDLVKFLKQPLGGPNSFIRQPFGTGNGEIAKFFRQPLGGENSVLRNPLGNMGGDVADILRKPAGGDNSEVVKAREAILKGDQGEVSKIIRDPKKILPWNW